MHKRLFFLIPLAFQLCFIKNAFPQPNKEVECLDRIENQISSLFKVVKNEKNNTVKLDINKKIVILFSKALNAEGAYLYPFDSLKYVGKILAPDKSFRLITWNIPLDNGTQRYFGYIQFPHENQSHQTIFLNDNHHPELNETDTFSNDSWYGALYYKIIPDTCHKRYLFLGLDLNNYFTSRKIIDVITFKNGKVIFGAPIFKTQKGLQHRVLFEYSASLTMMLHLDEKSGRIIFDHLSPFDPQYAGQYQFYGPDASYDGFQENSCIWELIRDLDMKNKKP